MADSNAAGEVVFQRGQDESEDEDIWDDTALIKAYDDAVSIVKTKVAEQNGEVLPEATEGKPKKQKKRKNKNKNKKRKWKVGDRCRAVYTEDGIVYEAEILSIDEDNATCQVRYLGYGNEEEHALTDLMTTSGKGRKARDSDMEMDSGMEWRGESPAPNKSRSVPSSMGPGQVPPSWPGFSFTAPTGIPHPPQPFPAMPTFPGFPGPRMSGMSQRFPPVPPPPPPLSEDVMDGDNESLCSMLMSWYMSGYHTGYYQGLKQGQQRSRAATYEAYSNR